MNNKGPTKLLDSVFVSEQIFDGMTVRNAIICGSEYALILDTLVFPHETKDLLSVCGNRKLIVVYSHADWDHVWGTSGLSPVEVIAHEECAKRFEDPHDVEKTLTDYQANHEKELAEIVLIPPQRIFRSTLNLDLGGITVELRHCPGHTKDSTIAFVPERSLLLGADCIERPLPILNEGAENLTHWIKMLSSLEQDPRIKICVPSHGEIGGRELLKHNVDYLKSLISGDEFQLPTSMDSFYQESHQENLEITAALRA